MCADIPSQKPKKKFLRIREVAEELGISERAAWRLVETGELASHGFGGSTRIARSDLDAYIERSKRRRSSSKDDDDDTGRDDPVDGQPSG